MSQDTQTPRRSILRRLLMLIFLFVVLLGVNLLYVPAASWRGVLTGQPGELLYAAGFDGFEDEWQQYAGRESAQIADSKLTLSIGSLNTIYSAAQPTLADFDYSVTAQAVSGVENNAFGVVFRLQEDETDCDMPLKLLCDLSQIDLLAVPLGLLFRSESSSAQGYYMFLISSDGYYSLWRGNSGGASVLSTWIPSDAIETGIGAENRLRVVARDDIFQFFINGTQIELCIPNEPDALSTYAYGQCFEGTMQAALQDATFAAGKIGVVVDTVQTRETDSVIAFDNVIIFSPETRLPEGDQT